MSDEARTKEIAHWTQHLKDKDLRKQIESIKLIAGFWGNRVFDTIELRQIVEAHVRDEMAVFNSSRQVISRMVALVDYETQYLDNIPFDKRTDAINKKKERLMKLREDVLMHEDHTEFLIWKLMHKLADSIQKQTIAAMAYTAELETSELYFEQWKKKTQELLLIKQHDSAA